MKSQSRRNMDSFLAVSTAIDSRSNWSRALGRTPRDPSATSTGSLARQFITWNRRFAFSRAPEDPQRLPDIALGRPLGEVLVGAQSGDLLGDRDVDQLVETRRRETTLCRADVAAN